jgi:predicted GNAT family N-acyltransferase
VISVERVTFGSVDYLEALCLRQDVMRSPQGLRFSKEQLTGEVDHIHLVAHDQQGALLGCVVAIPHPPENPPEGSAAPAGKVRQLVTVPEARRQGVGNALMVAAEVALREVGCQRVVLDAREGAINFYLSLGYVAQGEPFTMVGIPHLTMSKALV